MIEGSKERRRCNHYYSVRMDHFSTSICASHLTYRATARRSQDRATVSPSIYWFFKNHKHLNDHESRHMSSNITPIIKKSCLIFDLLYIAHERFLLTERRDYLPVTPQYL